MARYTVTRRGSPPKERPRMVTTQKLMTAEELLRLPAAGGGTN